MNLEDIAIYPHIFTDFYDHWFGNQTVSKIIWGRNSRNDFPGRKEQFEIIGSFLPKHSYCSENDAYVLADWIYADDSNASFHDSDLVVAYLDENLHQGYGKKLLPFSEIKGKNILCVPFYEGIDPERRLSERVLFIGDDICIKTDAWVKKPGWMTNDPEFDGDMESFHINKNLLPQKMVHGMTSYMKMKKSPLLAIDFVLGLCYDGRVRRIATDLNLAPGLQGTGVQNIVKGKNVAESIANFFFDNSCLMT